MLFRKWEWYFQPAESAGGRLLSCLFLRLVAAAWQQLYQSPGKWVVLCCWLADAVFSYWRNNGWGGAEKQPLHDDPPHQKRRRGRKGRVSSEMGRTGCWKNAEEARKEYYQQFLYSNIISDLEKLKTRVIESPWQFRAHGIGTKTPEGSASKIITLFQTERKKLMTFREHSGREVNLRMWMDYKDHKRSCISWSTQMWRIEGCGTSEQSRITWCEIHNWTGPFSSRTPWVKYAIWKLFLAGS